MKPDVILDVGTVDATYASLADKVQQQTGIPYILIDGSFANTPGTLRKVGELGEKDNAQKLAVYSEAAIWRLTDVIATIRWTRGRVSITDAGQTGWKPALPARSTWRCSTPSEPPTSLKRRGPAG